MFKIIASSSKDSLKIWVRDNLAQLKKESDRGDVRVGDLSSLLGNSRFSDVVFYGKNKKELVFAHKNILSLKCKYFNRMLQNGMMETTEEVIPIVETDHDTFYNYLHFLYTDKTKPDLTLKQQLKLFSLANRYLDTSFQKKLAGVLNSSDLSSFEIISMAKSLDMFEQLSGYLSINKKVLKKPSTELILEAVKSNTLELLLKSCIMDKERIDRIIKKWNRVKEYNDETSGKYRDWLLSGKTIEIVQEPWGIYKDETNLLGNVTDVHFDDVSGLIKAVTITSTESQKYWNVPLRFIVSATEIS